MLVVLIVFLALNAAVQLGTLAAVQGLAAQQYAVSPPGTDAAALEIALNERRLAFVLATDAKFDEPTNPDQQDRHLRKATNRWCTKWGSGSCSAANVVLMNDVDMVIEIAKELGWKDELKPVAEFDKTTYEIRKDKQQLEKNYDLKFDSNPGFIENHVEFEQRRYREASFHVKAKLCGLTFSTTWQGAPDRTSLSRPIVRLPLDYTRFARANSLYYRKVKWGS